MENYFETLTNEELARDRAQLSMLKQILEQTNPLLKRIYPGTLLGGPGMNEAEMLYELSDLAMKLREERKKKAEQLKQL